MAKFFVAALIALSGIASFALSYFVVYRMGKSG